MTRVFEDQRFANLFDNDSGAVFSDMEFWRCHFLNCVISNTRVPSRRSAVRNVRVVDCTVDACSLGPALLEDAEIINLRASRTVRSQGLAFKHVALCGRFGEMLLGPLYRTPPETEEDVKAINQANIEYYRNVDWALDIRKLDCTDCDIRGVPAKLILRDPETQAVVRREKAADGRWQKLDRTKVPWFYSIGGMLQDGYDDCVLVAGKRSRNFKAELEGIRILRSEGIADPD